ncbi:MAG: hypothetical protein IJQ39_08545 [Thermoguttaceae bacterium]|nr:hypothetical protein [Thermoguttaceae bacterium]
MSFLYIRPYFSVVDNNRCPISFYNRFLIALFVLGIGLTASVLIKILPQNDDISVTANVDESADSVKGYLESFPRDFTLNSSMMAYNSTSRKDNSNSGAERYLVEKQSAELSNVTMRPNYSDAGSGAGDNDEKPRLSPNLYEMPEEELLKLGYQRHRTRNGDTLTALAKTYLHDSKKWVKIYEFNKDQLTNEKVVPIGIVLIIPLN